MKFKEGLRGRDIKCAADKFLPFALVFGIYVILFGTISPGGGFQGGVIVSSACLLLYLGYGVKGLQRTVSGEVLRINEAVGAVIYVLLGVTGILMGFNFARNVFFDNGSVGDLVSAGTISFMSYAVGFKVLTGVGLLLLLMVSLLTDEEEDAPGEKAEQGGSE